MSISERQLIGSPEPWSRGPYAEAMFAPAGDITLRDCEGWTFPLEVGRWSQRVDPTDRTVLERCAGRVLDLGCGAGRLVEALASRGHTVLGIDVSPVAVISTVCRGGPARSGTVFSPVPDEGTWDTALLMDGNIGIEGDPLRLLRRVHDLVHPGGLLIVEAAPSEVDERRRVRIHSGQAAISTVFAWARAGSGAVVRYAALSGWSLVEEWAMPGSRHF
ncbi:class I SAM-dependent methyltransferase, partial [Streptomyces goshikiensis]|uniref:class I SAM-dependent methyltransferase n=1 Tax=Streptomyces goshikiensis TaxID=1942 RepID=UPI00361F8202